MEKTKIYQPSKKDWKAYLPYFEYEEDENIEDCGYLLKKVRIQLDSELAKNVIEGVEELYNYSDSKVRETLEEMGLPFELRLNEDQTNSYHLIMDDKATEYVSEANINIGVIEGELDDMVLATADGMCYGHVSAFEMLDNEGQEFIKTLLEKKLIRARIQKVYEEFVEY